MEDRYTINPYKPTAGRYREFDRSDVAATPTFRIGLIPATVLLFVAIIATLYGAMVVPNVVRDARNGYDARYLMAASLFPGLLFGLAFSCVVAGRQLMVGRWKRGVKALAVICGFAAACAGYISMLN